ncbi:MAG: sugar phosphate isomerase/epimerase [Firmicutes bacterium]|nr:sugar phosphate isomerase/epimerase [Bacillota bacterium]
MRIGISMYSYGRLLGGGWAMPEAIKAAKEAGYPSVSFNELDPPEGVSARDYAAGLREICRSEGLEVCAYTVGADFLTGCGGDIGQETERVMGCLDVAAELGARLMRHDAVSWSFRGGRGGYKEAAAAVAPHIRRVTEYGRSIGIKTMCENHGYFFQDSSRMEYLAEAVNHPNFGLLVDMGNFLCVDEDPAAAVGRLADYAFHVHAKDFLFKDGTGPRPAGGWFTTRAGNYLRGTIVGHGVVPVRQCMQILRNSGYDGGVDLEFEGPEDPREAAALGHEFLKYCDGM